MHNQETEVRRDTKETKSKCEPHNNVMVDEIESIVLRQQMV